ncbi:hypothetical protein D3C87_1217180 [compost metagenome]
MVEVDVGIAALVQRHHAGAHRACLVQRRGHVQRAAILVPRAEARADRAREGLAVGVLAHQVDRRAGVARAGHQARGAAHHFNAVVDEGIVIGFAIHGQADGRGHAVVLQAVDVEAARPEVGAVSVFADHLHANHVAHHLVQRTQVLVIDALARHHADGLRRLAQRQRQAGGRRRGRRGVGTRALGHCRIRIAQHRHGRQVGHAGVARQDDAVALPAVRHARALQQAAQGFFGRQAAAQPTGVQAGDHVGRVEHAHLGLGRPLQQRVAQGLRADIDRHRRVLRLRGIRHHAQPRPQRQAQRHHQGRMHEARGCAGAARRRMGIPVCKESHDYLLFRFNVGRGWRGPVKEARRPCLPS